MKTYRLYQVDSFTRERFHGNPAGVVPNADGLTDEQMQHIAREMNNSETAFILQANEAEADVEVRFFTPTTEVPLCGHATIAAHYVRAIEGSVVSGRGMQKTKAGILPVDIMQEGEDFSIVMTQGKPEVSEPFPEPLVKRIAEALGIAQDSLRKDCPVAIASAGHSKIMVGINSESLLHSLKPDMDKLTEISAEVDCNGYYVFTLHPDAEVLVHGRMFAPAIGIQEDPVTGNANGPLGAYLVHFGICRQLEKDNELKFTIRQGEAIKRDGGMQVQVKIKDHQPVQVKITGQAVVAFRTEIEL
ncbi:putative phenazine biosynthesis PhzC/PhzF family protein [Selenomonas ruminantium subsp. lactilytica TAM6421]|uniref:Putative phenazine biosynthesis PhzC/PhzF family protein n=1 Tax=Selenomonas ruminantium subsp. lactilytica (strain NBRC 103574 / TAM6421) TaxID=927704 RepID=I0GSC7_SELRL|nr:PhzF family isomerase [Selenomonas ruminantium]BAL83664.1 putative phenazine biosynthesis PhzC/PhzF family protein [Selenomonas ruminantium subsp. lactilytica TAM6421]